jgi:hypothetical protein
MITFNWGAPDSVSGVLPLPQLPEAGLHTQTVRLSLGFMMRLPLLKLNPLMAMEVSDHDAVLRVTRSLLSEFPICQPWVVS